MAAEPRKGPGECSFQYNASPFISTEAGVSKTGASLVQFLYRGQWEGKASNV